MQPPFPTKSPGILCAATMAYIAANKTFMTKMRTQRAPDRSHAGVWRAPLNLPPAQHQPGARVGVCACFRVSNVVHAMVGMLELA